ncbi:helix-turn-helix domain-containing protein [Actinomadura sp. SCN-SB]|uniref:helix-turn-helix domain-containing protein n=1 Tax=Actinomadura sp. SCN-SB TaxID=3373092 RepID=UPI00375164F2
MSPDELDTVLTLRTAVARYEELRVRDLFDDVEEPLGRAEALELIALGEVIARKARYGRQLAVRTAREAGASWSQIGRAMGTSKQTAWETHNRWIEQQRRREGDPGHLGMGEDAIARERHLAGPGE